MERNLLPIYNHTTSVLTYTVAVVAVLYCFCKPVFTSLFLSTSTHRRARKMQINKQISTYERWKGALTTSNYVKLAPPSHSNSRGDKVFKNDRSPLIVVSFLLTSVDCALLTTFCISHVFIKIRFL